MREGICFPQNVILTSGTTKDLVLRLKHKQMLRCAPSKVACKPFIFNGPRGREFHVYLWAEGPCDTPRNHRVVPAPQTGAFSCQRSKHSIAVATSAMAQTEIQLEAGAAEKPHPAARAQPSGRREPPHLGLVLL